MSYAAWMWNLAMLLLVATWLLLVGLTARLVMYMVTPPRRTLAISLGRGEPTEPSEVGLRGEATTFPLSDGAETPGWLLEGKAPQGPAVVISHGHRVSRYTCLRRAAVLAKYASVLAVYDQRAHGESPTRRCTLGEVESLDTVTVAQSLPGLLERHGWPEAEHGVVAYGFSMGGQSVVKAAANHPGVFRGVISEAPYRTRDEPIYRHLWNRRLPVWPIVGMASWIVRTWFEGPGPFDRVVDAKRITVPMLVMHGDADDVCHWASGQAIAEAAPRGTFVNLPGHRHDDPAKHVPEPYDAGLEAWFAALAHEPSDPLTPDPEEPAHVAD